MTYPLDFLIKELHEPKECARHYVLERLLEMDAREAAPALHKTLKVSLQKLSFCKPTLRDIDAYRLLIQGLARWEHEPATPDICALLSHMAHDILEQETVDALKKLDLVDELLPYWYPNIVEDDEDTLQRIYLIKENQFTQAFPVLLFAQQASRLLKRMEVKKDTRDALLTLARLEHVPMLLGLQMYPTQTVRDMALKSMIRLYEEEPRLRDLLNLLPKNNRDKDQRDLSAQLLPYVNLLDSPDWVATVHALVRWLQGEPPHFMEFAWAQELEQKVLEEWPLAHSDFDDIWSPTLCSLGSTSILPRLAKQLEDSPWNAESLLKKMEPLGVEPLRPILLDTFDKANKLEIVNNSYKEDLQCFILRMAGRLDTSFGTHLAHSAIQNSPYIWVLRVAKEILHQQEGTAAATVALQDRLKGETNRRLSWEIGSLLQDVGAPVPLEFWSETLETDHFQFVDSVVDSLESFPLEARIRITGQLLREPNLPNIWPDGGLHEYLVDKLTESDTPSAREELLRTFRACKPDEYHGEEGTLAYTMKALGTWNVMEAMPDVLQWLEYAKDEYCPAATRAVEALGRAQYVEAAPLLLEMFQLEDHDDRWEGCGWIFETIGESLLSLCSALRERVQDPTASPQHQELVKTLTHSLLDLAERYQEDPQFFSFDPAEFVHMLLQLGSSSNPVVASMIHHWLAQQDTEEKDSYSDQKDRLVMEMGLFAWDKTHETSIAWLEERTTQVCNWLTPWWQVDKSSKPTRKRRLRWKKTQETETETERIEQQSEAAEHSSRTLRFLLGFHHTLSEQRHSGTFPQNQDTQLHHWASTLLEHVQHLQKNWDACSQDESRMQALQEASWNHYSLSPPLQEFEAIRSTLEQVESSVLAFLERPSSTQEFYEDSLFHTEGE
ncbi:MAG: hypothetical protein EP343_14970 [Deltaproteobacteria bacterium]|nr:MAG: hypothetical protein EP343_14970 [Deltaproteobacteria bacterium]